MTTSHADHRPRARIRLPADCYLNGEPFLLTCCVARRYPAFRNPLLAEIATRAMSACVAPAAAQLWAGVVMPDHVHLLLSAAPEKSPLDCGGNFKRLTTLAARHAGIAAPTWQRRIYDCGVRTNFANDLAAAVAYVVNNPVRAGLVSSAEEWPYVVVSSGV